MQFQPLRGGGRRFRSLKPSLAIGQIQDQHRIQEILSQEKKKKENINKKQRNESIQFPGAPPLPAPSIPAGAGKAPPLSLSYPHPTHTHPSYADCNLHMEKSGRIDSLAPNLKVEESARLFHLKETIFHVSRVPFSLRQARGRVLPGFQKAGHLCSK